MPSLQLDAPAAYDLPTKRALAQRLGATYAALMRTAPETITVVIRDDGAVWRCTGAEPEPAALLMCDIRRGRTAQTRAELSRQLIAVCAEVGGLDPERIKVEFTQHAGDEMFHPHLGGFNREWSEDEPARPRARPA